MSEASTGTLEAPGKDTTEFKRAAQANWTFAIAAILGLALQIGPAVVDALGPYGNAGIVAGGVLQALGLVQKLLVDLGYIKSRTQVKMATAEMNKTVVAAKHGMSVPK